MNRTVNPILDTDARGGETTMPPDDELAEFFRAVLPEQEPPLPPHFVTDARVSGQRIKARRRLRMGVTTLAVCAVLAGAGTAAWVADRADRQASPTARPDATDDSAAIGRLAVAVQQNLTQHMRESSSDLVVMPPMFVVDSRPTVWRIELLRNGLHIGWIDITAGAGTGPVDSWQLRCPIQAFDSRVGDSVVCALPPPAPGDDPRVPPGSVLARERIEVLVIGEETGQHIVLTATGARVPGGLSDGPRGPDTPGDPGQGVETDTGPDTPVAPDTPGTDTPVGTGRGDDLDNGGPSGEVPLTPQAPATAPAPGAMAAPVAAVEMREILRHGDAPSALTALLGIGA
ncbi:hypothetical protein LO772_04580 [Yinghuangia sp. ASG 101]|uniref:hypothetical protein n=1 Tax=Yinghuangia sp. ASG 101 TaxID=2896848 RepID=UPI001E3FF325|nr:hypothetical protein [Yinghuangia sp. ASG 101]UGQ12900.1 hypothetical protein LO772_04580 [Yinghuangia sp. ASG 101]